MIVIAPHLRHILYKNLFFGGVHYAFRFDAEMNTVQQTINGLNTEIEETEGKISFTEMEIQNKQRDYEGRLAIFNRRLKEMRCSAGNRKR